MGNSTIQQAPAPKVAVDTGKFLAVLSGIFPGIVCLTILQDLLESMRRGSAFYLSESLLFKTVWLLFIPILAILYSRLKRQSPDTFRKTTACIVTPIVVHVVALPLIALGFSVLFYGGRYDLYKLFSYTVSNDFYKLIVIYGGFVLGYRYFSFSPEAAAFPLRKPVSETIIITNGQANTVISTGDIIQITSATQYVFIHLDGKKYLHAETLKSIGHQLDGTIFIRVHKSTIVNIAKVHSFRSRLNGDYDLQLVNGSTARVSRTYAADFKKRLSSGHRVSG